MNLKKILFSISILLVFLFISSNLYASQILIDSEDVQFNIRPDEIKMSTYISSNQIKDKINDLEIEKIGENLIIILQNNDHYVLVIKNRLVKSNKGNSKLTNPPIQINGHILLPVEFLVNYLDVNIIEENSKSSEYDQNNIKTNIYINKSEYADENMEVTIEIINNSNDKKELEFSSSKIYDIYIRNTNGNIIYTWSKNKMFSQAFKKIEIKANRSVHYKEKINLSEFEEGIYYIEAQIEPMNNNLNTEEKRFSIK